MTGSSSDSSYRAVLRGRDFRLLVAGGAASQVGDWLYNVALLVYVFQHTHSATWVAVTTMVRLIPLVLLGPLGGVVADRYERVQVMTISALVQWAVMVAITITVARDGPVLVVVLMAGLNTAFATASRPAALATLPAVVGESGLAPGNALLHTVQDVGTVGGPALGAVILAVGDPATAFAFNSMSFLAAALAFGSMRVRCPGVPPAETPGALALFVDGMRAVRHTPYVPVLTFLTFLGAFTYGAQTVQLVVYVQQRLHLSADGYGYLLGALGAGGVLGAAVSHRLAGRRKIAVPLVTAGLAIVGSQLLYAVTSVTAIAVAVGVLTGLGMVVGDVVSETAISRAAPGALMGRVFATYDAISVAGMVLGAVVAAPLIQAAGIRSSLLVLGSAAVVLTLACLPVLTHLDRIGSAAVDALGPIVRVLSPLPIFSGASQSALERLAAAAAEISVPAGAVVVAEGEPADAFFVCTAGSLAVTSRGESGGEPVSLRRLEAPAYFGEIGLIEAIPRTATVQALSECTLLRIDGATFVEALRDAPSGMRTLAEGVVRGLAQTHPTLHPARSVAVLADATPGR